MAKAHMAFPPGELIINCVGKIGQKSEEYFDWHKKNRKKIDIVLFACLWFPSGGVKHVWITDNKVPQYNV